MELAAQCPQDLQLLMGSQSIFKEGPEIQVTDMAFI